MNSGTRVWALVVAAAVLTATLLPANHAWARQSMSFVPGDRTRVRAGKPSRHVSGRSRHSSHLASRPVPHARHRAAASDEGGGSAATAVPGAGFTMQDGVLTYPAPARFQPGNLKHR